MEKWIEAVVGKMHANRITQTETAVKLGVSREYLNRVLNGKEKPLNAKERITAAVDELIKERRG